MVATQVLEACVEKRTSSSLVLGTNISSKKTNFQNTKVRLFNLSKTFRQIRPKNLLFDIFEQVRYSFLELKWKRKAFFVIVFS